MKFSSVLTAAALVGATFAQDVACLVDGVVVATVDLEAGLCPFTVPEQYPTAFSFVSSEEYDVTFYYGVAKDVKYFNDIEGQGRIIEIPAIDLYGTDGTPLYQVHLEETPAANSTAAIRKRLLKQVELVKKAEIDDFLATAKATDGTAIGGSVFAVVDIVPTSSSASGAGAGTGAAGATSTVTDIDTTIVTITTCSNNACGTTAVPATGSVVTTTVEGETTIYTTYCPGNADVTVTSEGSEMVVPATASLTTVTVGEEVTSYYTYCPLTGEYAPAAATTTAEYTEGPTTSTLENGETTVYVTQFPTTAPGATTAATTGAVHGGLAAAGNTVAAESTTLATAAGSAASSAVVSTYAGAANTIGSSAAALVVLAAGFLL